MKICNEVISFFNFQNRLFNLDLNIHPINQNTVKLECNVHLKIIYYHFDALFHGYYHLISGGTRQNYNEIRDNSSLSASYNNHNIIQVSSTF